MRKVTVTPPSFPEVIFNELLQGKALAGGEGIEIPEWEVLCGDAGHWRVGLFSPASTSALDVVELETHTCPEFFILLKGNIFLLLEDEDGSRRTLALLPGRPVLVTAAHGGFCPDGPHSGVALVVERDAFTTTYHRIS